MSSKGQVVIPIEMRENLKEGDKIVIIKSDNKLIMKKACDLDENFEEDVNFARRTEESLKWVKEGKAVKMKFEDFISELKK